MVLALPSSELGSGFFEKENGAESDLQNDANDLNESTGVDGRRKVVVHHWQSGLGLRSELRVVMIFVYFQNFKCILIFAFFELTEIDMGFRAKVSEFSGFS